MLMRLLAPIPPGLFLSILLGTLYGAVGHLVMGRHWFRLLLYVLGGIGGCAIAWLIGLRIIPGIPAPGGLPIIEGSVLAWLLLCLIGAYRRA